MSWRHPLCISLFALFKQCFIFLFDGSEGRNADGVAGIFDVHKGTGFRIVVEILYMADNDFLYLVRNGVPVFLWTPTFRRRIGLHAKDFPFLVGVGKNP